MRATTVVVTGGNCERNRRANIEQRPKLYGVKAKDDLMRNGGRNFTVIGGAGVARASFEPGGDRTLGHSITDRSRSGNVGAQEVLQVLSQVEGIPGESQFGSTVSFDPDFFNLL
jgi:hypothetical protein